MRSTVHGPEELDRLTATALDRPAEGLARARELLAGSPEPLVAAVAHQTVGIVLRDFGAIDEALAELRTARRLARGAGDLHREADILSTLASAMVMAGQTRRGLATLAEAIAVRGGPDLRLLVRRAHVAWLLGRHPEALDDARRAVELAEADPAADPVWRARAYSHRAMALQALGQVAAADTDFARCERLFADEGQLLEYAAARQDRGAAAFARGDLPAALGHLDDAQRIVEDLDVFEPDLVITRSQVLLAAGLFAEALDVADTGLARGEQLGAAATRRAELLLVAAMAARGAGDCAVAVERADRARVMFRRQGRPAWADRAELLLLQSRYEDGEDSATLLRRARLLADRLSTVEAELVAGRLAVRAGRREVAELYLTRAAATRSPDLAARTAAWAARATLAESRGGRGQLLAACARGLELVEVHLSTLGGTELRAGATAHGAWFATLALRHVVRSEDAALLFGWAERWRATALAVPPVRPAGDDEAVRDLSALRDVSRRDREAGPGPGPGRGPLAQERRRLEHAVRARALRQAAEGRGPARAVTPAEVRTELLRSANDPSGRVGRLVQLTEVDGELYAVVVPAVGPATALRVGPAARARYALERALFSLRREAAGVGRHRLDLDGIGAALQQALLGEVFDLLEQDGPDHTDTDQGGAGLVLVPPGRLHAIPWGLVPGLRARAVTVAPSASAWVRARRAPTRPDAGGRVVLVAGPGLQEAQTEIDRLADRYPHAEVLTGADATAERVLRAIDGAGLVHIAAHGVFRADSPLFSALELHDGPLTAHDLHRLRVAPHRVVLSSCDSALGAASGADELLGLVSVLISAGTAGVLASVVPIDDPSTVPFMLAVHERLEPGASFAAALAHARAAVRDDPPAWTTARSFLALGA